MLVLTRKKEDEIVIGGNIRIKVIELAGNRVKLGISAPSDVQVDRGEVEREPRLNIQDLIDQRRKARQSELVVETEAAA